MKNQGKKGKNEDHTGKVEIFCAYITRNGKRIYPKKGKFFHFWVDAKKAA